MAETTFQYIVLAFLTVILSVQSDVKDWIGAISALAAIAFFGLAIFSEFFI